MERAPSCNSGVSPAGRTLARASKTWRSPAALPASKESRRDWADWFAGLGRAFRWNPPSLPDPDRWDEKACLMSPVSSFNRA